MPDFTRLVIVDNKRQFLDLVCTHDNTETGHGVSVFQRMLERKPKWMEEPLDLKYFSNIYEKCNVGNFELCRSLLKNRSCF